MIKVIVKCDGFKAQAFYHDDTKSEIIRSKILSQMNNGHTVILGEDRSILLNPKVIKSIQIIKVADD
ncbi:hypothetical protein V2H22_06330 [Streptococcus suis]|uniref:hypothetical protein n=1 Tax=Streptococcus suis TaxID=1307 RepID=UPI002EB45252|nr:hypothetical protein [Streptococcus suis]MEE3732972.1 hypothetical protein [Streptococcus suis]